MERHPIQSFEISDSLKLSEGQQMGLEVMDELINDKFGFHIIEPIVQWEDVVRAKPVVKK